MVLVEWKTISIQIILPLITSSLAISAFGSFYNDTYNKPNIQVEIIANEIDKRMSSVVISNNGRVPANDVLITIEIPKGIYEYEIFNTENMTILNSTQRESGLLVLYLPRLVNGEGSVIKIIIIAASNIVDYKDYNVYVAYEQGSIKVGAIKSGFTFRQLINDVYSGEGVTALILAIISTIASVALVSIPRLITRRRTGRLSILTKYAKVIDSTYETLRPDKDECLRQLSEIQKEITQLFMRGKINEMKYSILNDKISIYLSRL